MEPNEKQKVIAELLKAGRPDLANAVALPYSPEVVTASSLVRILEHFTEKAVGVGVCILTGDRSDRADNPQENAALNNKARQHVLGTIQRYGLRGWVNVKGGYVEDPETGVAVYEHSFLVPACPRDVALKLAKALGEGADLNSKAQEVKQDPANKLKREASPRQDAIFWGNNEEGAWLFYHDGRTEKIGSRFVPEQVSQYFTEWHKRRFTFSEVKAVTLEYCPTDPGDYRAWRYCLFDTAEKLKANPLR